MIPLVAREIQESQQLAAKMAGRCVTVAGLLCRCAEGVLPPNNRVSQLAASLVARELESRLPPPWQRQRATSTTSPKASQVNSPRRAGLVLDLGCGSGILALVAARYAGQVIGIDIDERAVSNAGSNATLNQIDNALFLQGDLYSPVTGTQFDLIVSNPPFYPTSDALHPPTLQTDGLHSPTLQADSSLFERLILPLRRHLRPEGRALFFTSSLSDNASVQRLLEEMGLSWTRRVIEPRRPQSQAIHVWKIKEQTKKH